MSQQSTKFIADNSITSAKLNAASVSATFVPQSEVGAANGVASLDGSGKIPAAQLPSTVLEYQGNWDPSTNTPALSDLTGTNGFVYRVTVAFAGPIVGLSDPSMVNFQVGNLVIYSSSAVAWQQSSAADGVVSVNGAQGVVTVNAINQLTGDVTASAASGSQSKATSLVATSNSTLTTLSALALPASQLTGTLQGAQFPALTGDITTSAGSLATTLATVNSNTGSFGSSTAIPSFTVNGKGLITAASTNAVIAPAGTLTGTTLANNVVSSSLTSVGTITSGTWTGTTIAIANGGTGQTSKSAAFDALSPMTTGGDIIYGGASGTGTRLANGSSGQVLTSNGGTSAPSWQTPSAGSTAFNITSQSTTYSASINDYILCSGASFTVTLPTAVGNSGKLIVIQHNGTSLSQVYTLNTTSSQTIGSIASGTYKLVTNGEVLTLVSDNSNWQIQDHKATTGWTSTTTSWSGSTTNPTKGTVTTDALVWRRVGSNMEFRLNYNQTTGGTNGSGDYSLGLPTNIMADTTNLVTVSTVFGNANMTGADIVGNGNAVIGTPRGPISAYLGTSTTIKFWFEGSQVWNSGGAGFSGANYISITGSIPISTWQP